MEKSIPKNIALLFVMFFSSQAEGLDFKGEYLIGTPLPQETSSIPTPINVILVQPNTDLSPYLTGESVTKTIPLLSDPNFDLRVKELKCYNPVDDVTITFNTQEEPPSYTPDMGYLKDSGSVLEGHPSLTLRLQKDLSRAPIYTCHGQFTHKSQIYRGELNLFNYDASIGTGNWTLHLSNGKDE